jgi:hypothetical protein
MLLKILIPAIIIIGLSMAAIAIKMFVKKGSEFKKSCGSVDPTTGRKVACTCGGQDEARCENKVN